MKIDKEDILDFISETSIKLVKERDSVIKERGRYLNDIRKFDFLSGKKEGLDRGLSYLRFIKEIIRKTKIIIKRK